MLSPQISSDFTNTTTEIISNCSKRFIQRRVRMSDKKIADLFKIENRFLRSAHLERDFQDPTVLSGYVMTDFTRSCLGRMANGLKSRSGQRSWRMTGGYCSVKSSFALLLAHWFA